MSAGAPPTVVRRLDGTSARALADLSARFDDLQTVLKCCERLVTELAVNRVDDVVVEAVWTTALLSYARCFATGATDTALTKDDLKAAQQHGEVGDWHQILLQLRDHYAHGAANPRETFSVGVALDGSGTAEGIAITSARQPLVNIMTVKQAGAIAFVLSELLDSRITAQQEKVFEEAKAISTAELEKLSPLDIVEPE